MNTISITNIEKMVISSMIFDSTLFQNTILKSKDFQNPQNRKIFQIMENLHKKELPFDEDFILKYIPENEKSLYEKTLIDILSTNSMSEIRAYELEIKESAKKIALESLLNSAKNDLKEKESKDIFKTILREIELIENEYKASSLFNIKKVSEIIESEPTFLIPEICPIQENEINIMSSNGGGGKSYFCAYLSLELIIRNKKVFAWFSEDDEGHTKKRFKNIINIHKHLKLIDENLTIVGRNNMPFHFVERTNRKLEINEMFFKMKRELKSYDVIILDPLIAYFGGDENNNSEARYFMSLLNSWCASDKKTILLIHHNNKIDKDGKSSTRGASAFIDACRMQYTLHYGIKEHTKNLEDSKKEKDISKRLVKLEKKNHWHGKEEFEIQLFNKPDVYIEYEKKEDSKSPKKEINTNSNKYSSLFN